MHLNAVLCVTSQWMSPIHPSAACEVVITLQRRQPLRCLSPGHIPQPPLVRRRLLGAIVECRPAAGSQRAQEGVCKVLDVCLQRRALPALTPSTRRLQTAQHNVTTGNGVSTHLQRLVRGGQTKGTSTERSLQVHELLTLLLGASGAPPAAACCCSDSSCTSCCTVGTCSGSKSQAAAGSMGTHTLPVLGCTQNGACSHHPAPAAAAQHTDTTQHQGRSQTVISPQAVCHDPQHHSWPCGCCCCVVSRACCATVT